MKRSALIGLARGVGIDRPHRLGKPGKGRIGPRGAVCKQEMPVPLA
jgi:hypothetical protein